MFVKLRMSDSISPKSVSAAAIAASVEANAAGSSASSLSSRAAHPSAFAAYAAFFALIRSATDERFGMVVFTLICCNSTSAFATTRAERIRSVPAAIEARSKSGACRSPRPSRAPRPSTLRGFQIDPLVSHQAASGASLRAPVADCTITRAKASW
jgi:hypothetical protein